MYDRWYADVEVGVVATYGEVTVTEALLGGFADLTGDHHRLHVDADFAGRSRYGQRIAPGLLVLSLAFGMFPVGAETVLAFHGMDEIRFRRPTHIGDVLRARSTVLAKTAKSFGGLVDHRLEVLNQHDEVVATANLRAHLADRTDTPTLVGSTA